MKRAMNWMVFLGTLCYGAWNFLQFLGMLFVVGNNDTALEVVGVFAYGLSPIPLSFLALRHRRLAALCFGLAGLLWAIGTIDGEFYLQKQYAHGRFVQFAHPLDRAGLVVFVTRTTGVFVALALFYLITDVIKWPQLGDSARTRS